MGARTVKATNMNYIVYLLSFHSFPFILSSIDWMAFVTANPRSSLRPPFDCLLKYPTAGTSCPPLLLSITFRQCMRKFRMFRTHFSVPKIFWWQIYLMASKVELPPKTPKVLWPKAQTVASNSLCWNRSSTIRLLCDKKASHSL